MKERTLNEYRQTKEYKLSDQGGDYTVPHKGADPVQQVLAQQIEELAEKDLQEGIKEMVDKDKPAEIKNIQKEITREDQIQEIAEIVTPTIYDVIFQEIIEVMENYDDLNWGYFVQDDAPTALLDACFDHKQEIHYEIFQLVLQKLK